MSTVECLSAALLACLLTTRLRGCIDPTVPGLRSVFEPRMKWALRHLVVTVYTLGDERQSNNRDHE